MSGEPSLQLVGWAHVPVDLQVPIQDLVWGHMELLAASVPALVLAFVRNIGGKNGPSFFLALFLVFRAPAHGLHVDGS